MNKVLIAEFTAKSGSGEAVERLVSALAEEVRQEPGNLAFNIYRIEKHPDKFVVFEVYEDDGAFATHISAAYTGEFNRALAGLIVEDGSQLTGLARVA
jgi:quinol monooxygenase YgiN